MLPLALALALIVAAFVAEVVVDTRARRLERARHERAVAALERELGIGLPLDVRLGGDPLVAAIDALPSPTPLGLHIDCLLRMGVITFGEWLALADEHNPLTFTDEVRFDPPTMDDRAEADRSQRERWSRLT